MMKKVCVIGHFAREENLLNGQTVKTKIITKEIMKEFGKEQISCVDTHGGVKALRQVPIQCINALKFHKNIVIFPAENGLRIFAPLLVGLNIFFHKKLHYVVIGGWLPNFLENRKILSAFLKKFNVVYVETNEMKSALGKMGFDNIVVVPNCKELVMLKHDELILEFSEPYKLCTFSRVMKEKGIEEAVDSVKRVNKLYNRVVYTLDIYGPIDLTQVEWFEKLKMTFPEYIRYGGIVPFDKSTMILKQYYALLFPTFYEGEGFAGTLIDAMAAGVPVIASNWRYNSEIIANGKTGIIIKDSLDSALIYAFQQKEKWIQMKEKCLIEAKKYCPKVALKRLIDNLK